MPTPPTPRDGRSQLAAGETLSPADSVPSASGPFGALPATFGKYRIEKVLGTGAMGTVYLAVDTELDRNIALKVPKLSDDDAELALRLRREAKAAATLDHPHICRVYEVGEFQGRPFIAMQFIDGVLLTEYIGHSEPLTERQSANLVRKLALALADAHQHGVVHRDLKPANIMINRRGEPVIMDFGLAFLSDSQAGTRATKSGMLIGSPAYMSPEQARGEISEFGPWTDIYCLGTLFFELLTGQLPFEGPLLSLLAQIGSQDPPIPSTLRPGLSPVLERLCLRMMAKSREDRPASMHVVADTLRDWLKGESISGSKTDELATLHGTTLPHDSGPLPVSRRGMDAPVRPPQPNADTRGLNAEERGRPFSIFGQAAKPNGGLAPGKKSPVQTQPERRLLVGAGALFAAVSLVLLVIAGQSLFDSSPDPDNTPDTTTAHAPATPSGTDQPESTRSVSSLPPSSPSTVSPPESTPGAIGQTNTSPGKTQTSPPPESPAAAVASTPPAAAVPTAPANQPDTLDSLIHGGQSARQWLAEFDKGQTDDTSDCWKALRELAKHEVVVLAILQLVPIPTGLVHRAGYVCYGHSDYYAVIGIERDGASREREQTGWHSATLFRIERDPLSMLGSSPAADVDGPPPAPKSPLPITEPQTDVIRLLRDCHQAILSQLEPHRPFSQVQQAALLVVAGTPGSESTLAQFLNQGTVKQKLFGLWLAFGIRVSWREISFHLWEANIIHSQTNDVVKLWKPQRATRYSEGSDELSLAIYKLLDDADASVRLSACEMLLLEGDHSPALVKFLAKLLDAAPSGKWKGSRVHGIDFQDANHLFDCLHSLTGHSAPAADSILKAVREGRIEAGKGIEKLLAEMGPAMTPVLMELLKKGRPEAVRELPAFRAEHPDLITDALIEALANPMLQVHAVTALGKMDKYGAKAIPHLERLVNDPSTKRSTQLPAKSALTKLKDAQTAK